MDLRRATVPSLVSMTSDRMKQQTRKKVGKKKRSRPKIRQEIKEMVSIAIPVTVTTTARLIIYNTDIAYLGHLGENQLAGAALSIVVVNLVTVTSYICNPCTILIAHANHKKSQKKYRPFFMHQHMD